jgi:DhnA family fructose-bisphosphate aldolase class Ia
MDARTGKKIRLGRLFNQASGRTVIVAYSHGSFMGPLPGMDTKGDLLSTAAALRQADGLMIAPGMVELLEDNYVGKDAPALIVQIDWQSFSRKVAPYATGAAVAMTTVEQVAAAGGDAVMSYLYLGFQDPEVEKQEIARNAMLVRACEQSGLLLMIEPRSAIEKLPSQDRTDVEMMRLYARISAELGADLVKVIDPGDDHQLARIVEGCPARVLLAGGSQKASFAAALERAETAIRSGCAGVVYGRNIFQHEDPRAALAQVMQVVHKVAQ